MSPLLVIAIVLLAMLSLASLALNAFCLHVVRKSPTMLKRPSILCIYNLLLLQVFQACCVIPFYITSLTERSDSHDDSHITRKRICNTFRYSYTLALYGSCLGVFLTTIDRFLAVFWITHYKLHVTHTRMKQVLILLWFYLITVCSVPYIYTTDNNNDDEYVVGCTGHNNHHLQCSYNPSRVWIIIMSVLNELLPYMATVLMYIYTVHRTKRNDKCNIVRNSACLLHASLPNQVVMVMKKKDTIKCTRATKIAYLLCIAYAVLCSPSAILYTLKYLCPTCFSVYYRESCMTIYIELTVNFIAFLNLIAVPIICCFYEKELRRAAREIWRKERDTEEQNLITCDDEYILPNE